MAPKKKGKGSKLARMTEEERARYLQHRAAIEEEQRRRKQQLIATYMKIKLKREEAFTRLNIAKLNQEWRQKLRNYKVKELKQDLENLWQAFEHAFDRKNRLTDALLAEIDAAGEQYTQNLQAHVETIDKLLGIHQDRLSDLHSDFELARHSIVDEASHLQVKMQLKADESQDHLRSILYTMEMQQEEFYAKWKAEHTAAVDDTRNNILTAVERLVSDQERSMEQLWKNFQVTLRDYTATTDARRAHYIRLKLRDAEGAATYRSHCERIDKLQEQVASLHIQMENLSEDGQQENATLRGERASLTNRFWAIRNCLVEEQKMDADQLKQLTLHSNKSIKQLQEVAEKGERILLLSAMCRKMETEQEKLFPFGQHSALDENDLGYLHAETKMLKTESVVQEYFDFTKLENFWQRYNRTLLERAALSLHQDALMAENEQLRLAVRRYLDSMAIGNASALTPLPLPVVRPGTTRPIHRTISLLPEEVGVNVRKRRPVTCIEANTSIAVMHMARMRVI